MAPTRKEKRIAQFKLVVTEELREKIRKAAKQNRTSLNGEIVRRSEQSFDQRVDPALAALKAQVDVLTTQSL